MMTQQTNQQSLFDMTSSWKHQGNYSVQYSISEHTSTGISTAQQNSHSTRWKTTSQDQQMERSSYSTSSPLQPCPRARPTPPPPPTHTHTTQKRKKKEKENKIVTQCPNHQPLPPIYWPYHVHLDRWLQFPIEAHVESRVCNAT